MGDKLIQLGYSALSILVPVLVALGAEFLRRKLGTERIRRIQEELATKQELAALAIRFVEQAYKDLHGPEKYQKAAEWLATRAQEHGIKLTADEIEGLIEAALRMAKDEFGEQWANVINKDMAVGGTD